MNKLDELRMKEFPTVMVPAYGTLDPCERGKSRLLMGADGLYLEGFLPWGRFCQKLWDSPRRLPYGEVNEQDCFREYIGDIQTILWDEMKPEAAVLAEKRLEWAGLIVWNASDGLSYLPVDREESVVRVVYQIPRLGEGDYIIADVHSHHTMDAGFSMVDDRDDTGTRWSMVIGGYRRGKFTEAASRYVVNGFHFDAPVI